MGLGVMPGRLIMTTVGGVATGLCVAEVLALQLKRVKMDVP
jgi:hypothetical protein